MVIKINTHNSIFDHQFIQGHDQSFTSHFHHYLDRHLRSAGHRFDAFDMAFGMDYKIPR